jgi:hypothetical protein
MKGLVLCKPLLDDEFVEMCMNYCPYLCNRDGDPMVLPMCHRGDCVVATSWALCKQNTPAQDQLLERFQANCDANLVVATLDAS